MERMNKLLSKEECQEILSEKGKDSEDFFEYACGLEVAGKYKYITILTYINR